MDVQIIFTLLGIKKSLSRFKIDNKKGHWNDVDFQYLRESGNGLDTQKKSMQMQFLVAAISMFFSLWMWSVGQLLCLLINVWRYVSARSIFKRMQCTKNQLWCININLVKESLVWQSQFFFFVIVIINYLVFNIVFYFFFSLLLV